MLSVFDNKVVLITGNTGFKGSWLATWLLSMGAKVIGFADGVLTDPSHFSLLDLERRVVQIWGDIANFSTVLELINNHKPDFIFHLAAQSLVRKSYKEPLNTFQTNYMGTVNVLEAIRVSDHPLVAVIITSDKVYENFEKLDGYKEDERLGGNDPYSGSKASAEMAINSYYLSFFSSDHKVKIGVARAGNVIGGGDWSEDRIIPDAIRAWSEAKNLVIRNPSATRPWQHVLEPISGYLTLASTLSNSSLYSGSAFNFGPPPDQNFSVNQLLRESQKYWPDSNWKAALDITAPKEAGLLRLSCEKASTLLGWKPILSFEETIELTFGWYEKFYAGEKDIWRLSQDQIANYKQLGIQRGAIWA